MKSITAKISAVFITSTIFFNVILLQHAYCIEWPVQYISQRSNTEVGESACGPTSIAMLLNYYYPNAHVNITEVYHSGIENYIYEGPPACYRNVGWLGNDQRPYSPPENCENYFSSYSSSGGMVRDHAINYLHNIWGMQTQNYWENQEQDVWNALDEGPLLGHVWGNGIEGFGHYIVIVGKDNSDPLHEYIIVHDPETWAGDTESRENYYVERTIFFTNWYRDAIKLIPNSSETEEMRTNTVIVDTGHNNISGNSSDHSFNLYDIDGNYINSDTNGVYWDFYYGPDGGDWVFPIRENLNARWTPSLPTSGNYEIAVKFRGDASSGNVTYRIYNHSNQSIGETIVNQYSEQNTWTSYVIASSVFLENGAYVQAENIPINTNIDAIKFKCISKQEETLTENIATALIIDSSGSMGANDSTKNRLEAARYFIESADPLDYISIVDFDSNASSTPLYLVDNNRTELISAVDQINSSGTTNIGLGLQEGFDVLSSVILDFNKFAILLTDGDGGYVDEALQYKNNGWRIYTVGLGSDVDANLLENTIAIPTGGKYFPVSTIEAAQNAITEIYSEIRSISSSRRTLLDVETIVPQGGIKEFFLNLGSKVLKVWFERLIPGSDVEMTLVKPNGDIIDRSTEHIDVYHALGHTYEIYSIKNPMEGQWRIRLEGTDTLPEGEPTKLKATIVVEPAPNINPILSMLLLKEKLPENVLIWDSGMWDTNNWR